MEGLVGDVDVRMRRGVNTLHAQPHTNPLIEIIGVFSGAPNPEEPTHD